MRKTFFSLLLLGFSVICFAENAKPVKANLQNATVFFRGAALTHTAPVSLTKGENEVIIEGLTPNIDINSLKINVNNSVMVASSEFTNDYLTEKKSSDLVKQLQDSIDFCNAETGRLATAVNINATALDLLKTGVESNVGGSATTSANIVRKGLTVAELLQNLEFYNTKATALEKSIAADTKQKDELSKTLVRLQNQIRQEQSNRGVYNGILKLNLVAAYPTSATVTVSYFTQAASWTPFYDMIISDVTKPVQLKGRSKVRQTTGIDWEKLNITLSTATPSKTKEAPVLSTWFLDFYQPVVVNSRSDDYMRMKNSISYDADMLQEVAAAPEYSDMKVRGGSSAVQSTEPLYIVDGVPVDNINNIDPNLIKSTDVLTDANAAAIYGSRGANGVVIVTTKQMSDFIIEEEKQISMEYKIDLSYSIPGNGKEQIIDLKNYELTADYKFYAVPKMDESVFLIADFKNWEKLGILSGIANITYDGTFIGQTFLNTAQTNQVLSVTLGTDKRVSVKRERLTDYSETKFLGNDLRQTFAYSITVKNNQNRPIKFTLKEPYPISKQKDIKVELNEKATTTPTFNKEDIGVLTWDFDLPAGASREFIVNYSVRYPKDRKVNF